MSRIAARPLGCTLITAMATTILCGCGQAMPDVVAAPRERHSLLQRNHSTAPVELAAKLAHKSECVPASYPADLLPMIAQADLATPVPDAVAGAPSPATFQGAPANDATARPLTTPSIDSAYAVSPKRSVHPDDWLAPLSGPSNPTPELIAVARQAEVHVSRALRLAERGARFTARAELYQALRLSAAALDDQRNTEAHSRALSNGLRALGEAEDFLAIVRAAHRGAQSIETVVQSHQTPILHGEPGEELNASRAIERYLSYAQEQLAAAAGDLQPAASALYALGKLEMSAAADIGSLEFSRAAVYLQAALIVNPQHALAANELGVLLARHGRLAEAKAALSHTLRIASLPAAWRNLSIVHHGLGELELAGRADQAWRQAASAQSQAGAAVQGSPAIQWVDPTTFAQSTQASTDSPAHDKANQTDAAPPVGAAEVSAEESAKRTSSWFPWLSKLR